MGRDLIITNRLLRKGSFLKKHKTDGPPPESSPAPFTTPPQTSLHAHVSECQILSMFGTRTFQTFRSYETGARVCARACKWGSASPCVIPAPVRVHSGRASALVARPEGSWSPQASKAQTVPPKKPRRGSSPQESSTDFNGTSSPGEA